MISWMKIQPANDNIFLAFHRTTGKLEENRDEKNGRER